MKNENETPSPEELATRARVKERDDRHALHNAILKTVKEYGSGLRIGVVEAVLAEVENEISDKVRKQKFDAICSELKEITLRTESNPQSND
ncbi:hypothetical protein AALA79_01955 [Lachnospiraceae bacterium 64-25]